MNVRAIALAVPLALGMACMHTQGQGAAGSASTAAPSAQQPQAAAGAATRDPLMQPGPAVQGHAGDEVVAGRISDVGDGSISIETQQGGTRTLQIAPETAIQVDGQDASFQDLAQGQQVRASFDTVGGDDVAVKIHARPLGAGSGATGSGTPTDRGATPGPAGGTGAGSDTGATPPAPDTGAGHPAPAPPNTGAGQGGSGPPSSW